MENKKLFSTGLIGMGVSLICCFTPLLVVTFGALGVSAWLAWADYVLWSAFVLFAVMAAVAYSRRRNSTEVSEP
jgi:mercuric ion transport protein